MSKKQFKVIVSKDETGKERKVSHANLPAVPSTSPLSMEEAIRRHLAVDDRAYLSYSGKGDVLTITVDYDALQEDGKLRSRITTAVMSAYGEHDVKDD